MITADGLFIDRLDQIVALAKRYSVSQGCHQCPAITTPSETMRRSPVMCSPTTST
jgi:hypothetical protein